MNPHGPTLGLVPNLVHACLATGVRDLLVVDATRRVIQRHFVAHFTESLAQLFSREIHPPPDAAHFFPCAGNGVAEVRPVNVVGHHVFEFHHLKRLGILHIVRNLPALPYFVTRCRHLLHSRRVTHPSRAATRQQVIQHGLPHGGIESILLHKVVNAALKHLAGIAPNLVGVFKTSLDVGLRRAGVDRGQQRLHVAPQHVVAHACAISNAALVFVPLDQLFAAAFPASSGALVHPNFGHPTRNKSCAVVPARAVSGRLPAAVIVRVVGH